MLGPLETRAADKGRREAALSRRVCTVLRKNASTNAEEAERIDKAARKRDVRMQLITTAVFAVGKILGYASADRIEPPEAAGVFDFKGTVNGGR